MLNTVYLTVLDYVETFDVATELNGETLETEAYPEYGSQELIGDVPDVFDNADVLGNVGRAWAGSDDDSIEVL